MHPFIYEQMAQMHRQELLHEAAVARSADQAYSYTMTQGNSDAYWPYRGRWGLIFGLPILSSSTNEAWLQYRLRATIRTVGLGAFGVGSLAGSFIGSRFGLLPAVVFSCVVCLMITLPVLARLLIAIKGHVHGVV